MDVLKKLQKFIEAINTYYAFALLVYAAALYVASDSTLFIWILLCLTPLLAAWGGYLLRSFVEQRTQRHGFRILSDSMTYEIGRQHNYTLRYNTRLLAATDHLMMYPICYRWSGTGNEGIPQLASEGQQLLAPLRVAHQRTMPFEPMSVSTEGNWHYWFVAFNPPIHKGGMVDIKYSQEFQDRRDTARPYIYYFVRTSMKKLELNVKFPSGYHPTAVTSSFVKVSDPNRPYIKPGVVYDADKQWATWVIHNPKRGYYRIDWQ